MKRMDQINVIPFIDIMLVLLAIVLTTATFISEGRLEIELPTSSAQSQSPLQPTEIGIDAAGGLYLDGHPLDAVGLGDRLDVLPAATPIVLRVDAQARFERFVQVVDALKVRELNRVTILTQPAS